MDHFHLLGLVLDPKNRDKIPDDVLGHLNMLRELPEPRRRTEENERLISYALHAIGDNALIALVNDAVNKDDEPN